MPDERGRDETAGFVPGEIPRDGSRKPPPGAPDGERSVNTPVATRFTLLTGIVDVTRLDPTTGRPSGPAVTMKPLQTERRPGRTP